MKVKLNINFPTIKTICTRKKNKQVPMTYDPDPDEPRLVDKQAWLRGGPSCVPKMIFLPDYEIKKA